MHLARQEGLTREQLDSLPSHVATRADAARADVCAICLCEPQCGDAHSMVKVMSWWCRSSRLTALARLGLTVQAPGYAMHSGRAAEPKKSIHTAIHTGYPYSHTYSHTCRAQWEVASIRP